MSEFLVWIVVYLFLFEDAHNQEPLFPGNTGVTSIGVEILTMKSLTSFLMEEQELGSTIPTHLYSLTKLTSLKIRKCSLIGTISSEIAQLSKLTNLVMGTFLSFI